MLSHCKRLQQHARFGPECVSPGNRGVGEVRSVEQRNAIHKTAKGDESKIHFTDYLLDLVLGVTVNDGVIAGGAWFFMMFGIALIVVGGILRITLNELELLWILLQRHRSAAGMSLVEIWMGRWGSWRSEEMCERSS